MIYFELVQLIWFVVFKFDIHTYHIKIITTNIMRFVIAGVIAALFAISGQAASEPVTADVVVVGIFRFIQKTLKKQNLLKLLLK